MYKTLKEYNNAVRRFQRAINLQPGNTEAYRQLAAVSALGFMTRGLRVDQSAT